ncbi:uncharacterized protein METZ01_LOCUS460936, partial [marine metagenome]
RRPIDRAHRIHLALEIQFTSLRQKRA